MNKRAQSKWTADICQTASTKDGVGHRFQSAVQILTCEYTADELGHLRSQRGKLNGSHWQ